LWDYRPGVWDYREATWTLDRDLVRYDVEALDGCVGMVDHAASDAVGAYVVVDLHSPGSGAHRLVPARAIAALDHDARKVHLTLTRHEVEVAPDYDPDRWNDDELGDGAREEHVRYYRKCLPARARD
jgi:hypothetical protein